MWTTGRSLQMVEGCVLFSAVNMGGSSVSSPPSGVAASAVGISGSGADTAKGGEM